MIDVAYLPHSRGVRTAAAGPLPSTTTSSLLKSPFCGTHNEINDCSLRGSLSAFLSKLLCCGWETGSGAEGACCLSLLL